MYHIELELVKASKREYDEELLMPAEETEISRLSEDFSKVCGLELPQAYLDLLRYCNGLEFNGCIVYGSENMIENQMDYEYISEDYVIFGEYDIGWFCMEKAGGKFCELDKPSAQEVQTFDTFEEMIKRVLSLSLEL